MHLQPDFVTDLYDVYLRAAVELRQITFLESNDLRYLGRSFGIQIADLEQLRSALVVLN